MYITNICAVTPTWDFELFMFQCEKEKILQDSNMVLLALV